MTTDAEGLSDGRLQALQQLREIEAARKGVVEIEGTKRTSDGMLEVRIRLDLSDLNDLPEPVTGILPRPREVVIIGISPEFPAKKPTVRFSDERFAGRPHVLWAVHLCLYAADNDWDPDDGMYGFVEQLAEWFERSAKGTLQHADQPLHPPVAVADYDTDDIVITADLSLERAEGLWAGMALLLRRSARRSDVADWLDLSLPQDRLMADFKRKVRDIKQREPAKLFLAPAIVLPTPLDFHYPETMADLAIALNERGFLYEEFIRAIALASKLTGENDENAAPLYLFVGAPVTTLPGSPIHLAAWHLDRITATIAQQFPTLFSSRRPRTTPHDSRDREREAFVRWMAVTPASWAQVFDARPIHSVVRRDEGSPSAWLRGRRILVIGCGALGARIAEHCLRAGAARIMLVDDGGVTPGVLVRQPFEDADIGLPKALALARRLKSVRPAAVIEYLADDALATTLRTGARPPEAGLVVDATASRAVAARLESLRWMSGRPWPPILTVGLGPDSRRGIAALALPDATGGGADILHALGEAAFGSPGIPDVAAAFFPPRDDRTRFVPEPGCSEPTFTGSDAEVSALAAQLFHHALHILDAHAKGERVVEKTLHIVRLDDGIRYERIELPNDVVIDTPSASHQIRVRAAALVQAREEARSTQLLHGHWVETGGILLGIVDDACRVIWITRAEAPPPDSEQVEHHFRLGQDGVEETILAHREASNGRIRFVGVWHTHPGISPAPSTRDDEAMETLLVPVRNAPRRAVLLVAGGRPRVWDDWLDGAGPPALHASLYQRVAPEPLRTAIPLP